MVALAVTLFGCDALILGVVGAHLRHRQTRADVVLAVLGVREVDHPLWLWIARAGVPLLVAGLVGVRRVMKASKPVDLPPTPRPGEPVAHE
ncbi:MAG TPA: hypothetical protein VIG48_06105 [Jatrophihabitans sp.]